MPRRLFSARWHYAAAVMAVALATLARLSLNPLLGTQYPLATYFFAVLLTAWRFGPGPAGVALGLGGVAAAVIFVPSGGDSMLPAPADLLRLALYLAVGAVVIAIAEGERRTLGRLQDEVADRRRAEEVAARWRDRYEAIIRATGHIAYDDDKLARQVVVTGDTRGILGLEPSALCGELNRWVELIHPDDRSRFDREYRASLEERRPFRLEYRVRGAGGAWKSVRDEGHPILDDAGKMIRTVGLVKDISEERRAEERLRLAVEATGLGIWESTPGHEEILWSAELKAIYGLAADATITVSVLRSLIHPDDLAALESEHASALDPAGNGTFRGTHRIVRGGETRWVDVSGVCLFDGDQGARMPVRLVGTALDVTDRKRAEDRLREREEWLRRIHDQTAVGIVTCRPDGTLITANPGFCEMLGYSHDEIPALSVAGLTHPDDRDGSGGLPRPIVAGEVDRYMTERRYLRKDGEWIWVSATLTTLRGADGEPQAGLIILQDISEKRRLSEQLEADRSLLDAFFASTTVALGLVDTEFRYLRVNEALARTNGVPAGDHLGRTIQEVLPRLWPTLEPLFRRVLETGDPIWGLEVEGETPGGGGVTQSWEINYYPVRVGGRTAGVGFAVVETTEARLREARLREAEQKLRERAKVLETVLAATPTPIWISYDRHCREITGNPASYRFLRMPEGAEVSATAPGGLPASRPFAEYRDGRPVDPRDLPMQIAAREGIEVQKAELTFVFDDGEVRHVYGKAVPLRDESGTVTGAIAAYVDITDLKLAEEAMRDADRRKDEFLAMLAHELRNPLAPIRNAVSLMELAEEDLETQRWSREVIERQVRHLTSLVDDLLDVSRITQGKIKLDRAPLALSTFINAAVESSRPLIEARHHRLEVSLPGEVLRVEGDPTRLSQVVLNLLNNAAKYTPEGGRIAVSAAQEEGQAVIRVRDDGEGIPRDMLPRIFDVFIQVDRSIDRSEGGLGIGLTLVRRLVEMHGGTVEARSEGPGQGSEFIVRLPLCSGAEAHGVDRRDEGRGVAGHLSPRRILVVDDSPDSVASLSLLLRRLGNEVATAADGPAACRAALEFAPDVVILDIGLPGMDGYEVARALRAEPSLDATRLIALSGYGADSDRRKSAEAGFEEHLVKPVDLATLRRIVGRPRFGSSA